MWIRTLAKGMMGASFALIVIGLATMVASAAAPTAQAADAPPESGMIAVGAGLAVGLAGLGTGMAQQGIGAAAVGAMAEDPKFFGKGIVMVALPETIVIFGLLIAFLLLGKIA